MGGTRSWRNGCRLLSQIKVYTLTVRKSNAGVESGIHRVIHRGGVNGAVAGAVQLLCHQSLLRLDRLDGCYTVRTVCDLSRS